LQRNLVYTGITRGKKLVALIGQRKALAMAVRNNRTENRFSGLLASYSRWANVQPAFFFISLGRARWSQT